MKDTDKIAAEAEASLWPYHSTRQIVTATEAQQRKNHNLTIIKSAIEKAVEWASEDYRKLGRASRAALARKEGDASCPAKQCPNTDTTPQGSNAAPTFNPKGAAAHASDGGVCPNCGVTWDKHSHNCRWRQHASEDEVRQGEGFSIQKGFSSE